MASRLQDALVAQRVVAVLRLPSYREYLAAGDRAAVVAHARKFLE